MATAGAQVADTTQRADTIHRADTLSYDDAAEVAYLYNLPAALRATRDLTVPASQTVEGDLSVLEASLTVAGHVTGRVVVINGEVTLAPGARIDGELVVTGGEVHGADSASVAKPSLSPRRSGAPTVWWRCATRAAAWRTGSAAGNGATSAA